MLMPSEVNSNGLDSCVLVHFLPASFQAVMSLYVSRDAHIQRLPTGGLKGWQLLLKIMCFQELKNLFSLSVLMKCPVGM